MWGGVRRGRGVGCDMWDWVVEWDRIEDVSRGEGVGEGWERKREVESVVMWVERVWREVVSCGDGVGEGED